MDLTGENENAIESIDFSEDERPIEKPKPPLAVYESSLTQLPTSEYDFRTDLRADFEKPRHQRRMNITGIRRQKNVLEHNRLRDRELKIEVSASKSVAKNLRRRFNSVATGVFWSLRYLLRRWYKRRRAAMR